MTQLTIDAERDAARLRAVRSTGLTDGVRSPVLDALCRVTTRALGVPTAMVTLLDLECQHCVGADGTDRLARPVATLPLSHSIGRHLLAGDSSLVIACTATHPLTRDTPPVTELGIGAYLAAAITDDRGRVLGTLSAIDTSPREWTERDTAVVRDLALAASAEVMRRPIVERYELAIEATAEVIYSVDPSGGAAWRAGAVERIYGRPVDELERLGLEGWVQVLHPDDRDRVVRSWDEVVASPDRFSWHEEYRMMHPDGRVVEVRDRARITRDASGAPRRIAGAVADVTVERIALAELQASETRFRTTLESLREGVVLQDRRDRVQLSNAAAARMLGLTEDQLHGRTSFDPGWHAIHEDGSPFAPTDHPSIVALRTNQAQSNVMMGVCKPDGSRVWISIDAEPIRIPGEELASSVVVTFRDVTHERETAAELARLAAIVSSSPYPVISIALDGTIRSWNVAAERFFGSTATEMLGRSFADTIPRERREVELRLMESALRGETGSDVESVRQRADGSVVPILIGFAPVHDEAGRSMGLAILIRDISATRRLEAELRQSQKLEAMGRLAGGVAHDFNNMLTAIRGSAELLRIGGFSGAGARDDLDEILRTVDRASGLTRQLLAFSRKQVVEPRVLSLNEVVRSTTSMLQRVIGETFTLFFIAADGDPLVNADRGQVEQVLLNLAVNARDAMPGGGTISIAVTRGVPGAPPGDAQHATVFERPHVILTVADTGSGMDEATRLNAFEPFFTTKEEGRGTGLGLSTVYGIATQGGGTTWITSTLGAGTTVHVALPLIVEDVSLPSETEATAARRYRGTLLLVEDERSVLEVTARLLQQHGFQVHTESTVRGGIATIDALTRDGRTFDAVVTDVVMPGGGGRAIVEHARRCMPDVPILIVSGYPADEQLRIAGDRRMGFLGKPFSARALTEALVAIMP